MLECAPSGWKRKMGTIKLLLISKRIVFVLTIFGIMVFYTLWIHMYSKSDNRFHKLWKKLISGSGGAVHLSHEAHEKCQVANLDLNEPNFLLGMNVDNNRRAYLPKCMPSSWKLFSFDYHSKLVRTKQKNESFWTTVSCCYIPFQRKENSDTEIIISPKCHKIVSEETTLPPEHEFINVICKEGENPIYSDLFGAVPIKPDVEKRILSYEKETKSKESDHERVNVVIIGLDSVSQYNMRRYLLETHNYIMRNLSGFQFSKYHRVDEYSFANMGCGFHMGMTREEVNKTCWPTKDAFLDTCPLIWKEFAAKGFRTSYSEDAVPWSIFWYHGECNGFQKQPTDYDFRTLTRRMEYFPAFAGEPTPPVCYGDTFDHTVVLDNIVRTAITLKNKLYFQFSWICAMTHNVPIMSKYIGNSVIQMFQELQKRNLMNNTVFMFMADHGMNFGPPAKTIQGTLEANFPFFYMIFPKWFSSKYPQAMKNLERNTKLLTSHFDSYTTLKDFLDLSSITDEALALREEDENYLTKRGISFFLPIPKNRDCQSAGLMSQFCSCWTLQDVPVDHYNIMESYQSLLRRIKTIFSNKYEKCMNIIRFGPVEKSKCTIPTAQHVANRITQKDLDSLRMDSQCEFQFKLLPRNTTVYALQKKSNGTWTLLDVSFSNDPSNENSCTHASTNVNILCDCHLTNDELFKELRSSQISSSLIQG